MPEAEGIRHSWKKFLFFRATAVPGCSYRWSFAEAVVRAGWRVASESSANVNAVKCFHQSYLRNGPASVRGTPLKGERRV